MCLAERTLYFVKIGAVIEGLFVQTMSEISPFVLFSDKKQQNKDDMPRIKKRYIL